MAHSAAVPSPAQPICAWSDNSRKFEIHIRPSVLERLATDCWVAFKRVPRRGLEIGGVLLGHAEDRGNTTTFWIHGFAAVESEYRSGPSYMPSESDLTRLQDEIHKNGGSSIGIFRSHTRPEDFVLQEPDETLLKGCFDPADALFLMVGPAPGKAALFLRTNGNSHCIHQLALPSLSSILLARQDSHAQEAAPHRPAEPEIRNVVRPIVRQLDSLRKADIDALRVSDGTTDHPTAAPLPIIPPEHAVEAAENPEKKDVEFEQTVITLAPAPAKAGNRTRWIVLTALPALAIMAALGGRFYSARGSSGPAGGSIEYVRLSVERTGPTLRVHWDRNAPTLRDATHAVLHVQDGDIQVERIVTPAELNAGSVLYQPKNSEVSFGLDVYSAGPHTTGMVQVMNLPTQVESQPTHSEAPPIRSIRPAVKHTPDTPPAALALEAGPQPDSVQLIAKPEEAKDVSSPVSRPGDGLKQTVFAAPARPSQVIETKAGGTPDLSAPKATEELAQPPVAVVRESAAPRNVSLNTPLKTSSNTSVNTSDKNSGPSVSVSVEPVSSSKIVRAVGRVPLLRRIASHDTVEPPIAVYEAQPSFALSNQQQVSHSALVDVKVDVTESGKVSYAEIVDWGEPPNFSLANAALAAAKQWTFKPARTEDLPVSSQVILHFRFNP